MRRILHENGLSIALFGLFLAFLLLQSIAGWRTENQSNEEHRQPVESYARYLRSGSFVEATFEKPEPVDEDPREARDRPGVPGPVRRGGLALGVYQHSLALALTGLFLMSFLLHAVGGHAEYNQEQLQHGEAPVSLIGFVTSAPFWFQSMQNWQSEFLAVFALVVLGIFLRQRGSPESKPVAAAHAQTGT